MKDYTNILTTIKEIIKAKEDGCNSILTHQKEALLCQYNSLKNEYRAGRINVKTYALYLFPIKDFITDNTMLCSDLIPMKELNVEIAKYFLQ